MAKSQRASDSWELFDIYTGRAKPNVDVHELSSVADAWSAVKHEALGLELEVAKKFIVRAPVLDAELELWEHWCNDKARLGRVTLRRLVVNIKDLHPAAQLAICIAWSQLHFIPSYSKSDGKYAHRHLAPDALKHLIDVADSQRQLRACNDGAGDVLRRPAYINVGQLSSGRR